MSQITQKQQGTTFSPIVQQSTNGSPAIKKQLPASIIQSISEFGAKPVNSQRVSKEWRELFSNDPILDLHNSKITDKELIEIIEKRKDILTDVDLSNCKNITYESIKHLSKLKNLKSLDLSGYENDIRHYQRNRLGEDGVPILEDLIQLPKLQKFSIGDDTDFGDSLKDTSLKHMFTEKVAMRQFIQEKSVKFGITGHCALVVSPETWMASECSRDFETGKVDKNYTIHVNPLFLIPTKDIGSFLVKYPNYQEDIKKFLTDKNPDLLDSAARKLITLFNLNYIAKNNKYYCNFDFGNLLTLENLEFNTVNISLAKQILVMHAKGKLDEFRRFDLTHELGHVCYLTSDNKSLGDFDPLEFPFIKPYQYDEVRADLIAARDGKAHELGIFNFELAGVFLKEFQSLDFDPHPPAANRVKALQVDRETVK